MTITYVAPLPTHMTRERLANKTEAEKRLMEARYYQQVAAMYAAIVREIMGVE